ncbi:MAG: hypothetical protein ABI835_10680 [Chloroflexota bacterium]
MSRKGMMQRDPDESGLFSLAAFQTLRIEALDLFDRSLAEGKLEYLERFLEQQVVQEHPPLELLSQIAEDVHQRLLGLRQRHFDARDGLRRALEHQYAFDLSPFLPVDPVEYHHLNWEEVLNFASPQLSEESRLLLHQTLQEALANAALLYEEISVAEYAYSYLMDWLMALHIVSVRGAWADNHSSEERSKIH